ncbi:UNVERIFIED_CONTAM: hypothetical protein Scaly_1948100 [Sesamum calycinum]|uniref:Uncharacterized protein n=1 Tax=Sesamum calycinum TaxID=2727403 RepID=A0AAW2NGD5_9LAMI
MATKLAFLFYLLFIATILAQKQASSAEVPASDQLHPQGSLQVKPNTETSLNYGMSEGSLRPQDAQRPHLRSRACSFARNAAPSVCVCPPARTAISKSALATTTGRPRGVALNAHETIHLCKLDPSALARVFDNLCCRFSTTSSRPVFT